MRSLGWARIPKDWGPSQKRRLGHRHTEGRRVRTQREGGRLRSKDRPASRAENSQARQQPRSGARWAPRGRESCARPGLGAAGPGLGPPPSPRCEWCERGLGESP